jgi:hypothetical protein
MTEDTARHGKVKNSRFEAEEGSGNCAPLNFGGYVETRPEIGLTRMLLNLVLEPQDPFKPDARRNFRKGFVLATVFSAGFIVWFIWFNVIR